MTLDARQLAVFLAIAEHGGVGRAAAALGLTQPALSRTLRQLENQLGAPLFERHSTGMVLTEYGRALEPRARLIAAESRRAVEDIRDLRGLGGGTLKVGAVASVLAHWLPEALGRLLTRYPGLGVEITEAVEDRLVAALLDYRIDLAIGVDIEETDQVAVAARPPWRDRSAIVAAPDHPLRRGGQAGERLSPGDLRDARWALPPPGTAPRETVGEIFRAAGLDPPRVAVTTRSVLTLKALVSRAGYLSYLPRTLFAAERAAGLIDALPVRGVARSRRFTVFRRRHGFIPRPAEALLAALDRDIARTTAITPVASSPLAR